MILKGAFQQETQVTQCDTVSIQVPSYKDTTLLLLLNWPVDFRPIYSVTVPRFIIRQGPNFSRPKVQP